MRFSYTSTRTYIIIVSVHEVPVGAKCNKKKKKRREITEKKRSIDRYDVYHSIPIRMVGRTHMQPYKG